MNIARWVGFVGAGVVLGACSGYSSLGEVAGEGGESGQGDAMGGSSTAAKGGQGHGGAHATGGAQGMGASASAVGGSSMGTTGGTGMGTTGGTGMGATGGTGMGTAGAGEVPVRCMTDDDCQQGPPFCPLCDDGSLACATSFCSEGVCGFEQPQCPTPCMVDQDCGTASCSMNPDGTLYCPVFICADGYCGLTLPSTEAPCASRECGDPCMQPDGVSGACDASGTCVEHEVTCGFGACASQNDCGLPLPNLYCGEDQSADVACLDGECQLVCPTELMCGTNMDCPKEVSEDPCSTGPWECPNGFCSRRYEACAPPME